MKYLGRIFFISLISGSAIVFYNCDGSHPSRDSEGPILEQQGSIVTTFKVKGLHCSSCENTLVGALQDKNRYPLIYSAKADHVAQTCEVRHDKKMLPSEIEKAINETKIKVISIIK